MWVENSAELRVEQKAVSWAGQSVVHWDGNSVEHWAEYLAGMTVDHSVEKMVCYSAARWVATMVE